MYRGRIAPSPTGYLHLGHARTFWIAQDRARQHNGKLVLRNEDLDQSRAKDQFVAAMMEDMRWFGFQWDEGPDSGGPFAPYTQSERLARYREVFEQLHASGHIYPCACSRQDVLRALQAPHQGEDEPVYPGTCRDKDSETSASTAASTTKASWRFRVPQNQTVSFHDGFFGEQSFIVGRDFGDFVVWRQDGLPAYQLSVVVDDHDMQITEVVRGADLLLSTARQILLYQAMGWTTPAFFHCPLMTDDTGKRLAKRHDALSLRAFREQGITPTALREQSAFSLVLRS